MKKKLMMATIGLVTGVTVFSATAFVALANNSNYETYKRGFFKLLRSANYTMDIKAGFEFEDGDKIEMGALRYQDRDKYYEGSQTIINGEVVSDQAMYSDENESVHYRDNKITYAYEYENDGSGYSYHEPEITASQEKLVDVVADLMLGDLKNSIVSEGNSIYIDVEEYQIPALAHAIFDVGRETVDRHANIDDEFGNGNEGEVAEKLYDLMTDPNSSIKSGNFEGAFDDSGYITKAKANVTIANGSSSIDFYFDFTFSDFGSTDVVKPDITEKHEDYEEFNAEDYVVIENEEGLDGEAVVEAPTGGLEESNGGEVVLDDEETEPADVQEPENTDAPEVSLEGEGSPEPENTDEPENTEEPGEGAPEI
ncbi:MAG: hypothetical protein LBV08_00610 [Clostridiales bacterium]|nr:hypothetical protein [Clostridiales bacterium]